MRPLLLLLASGPFLTAPTAAEPPIVASTSVDPANATVAVELIVTNADPVPHHIAAAPVIAASLDLPGRAAAPVQLERGDDQADSVTLPPSGFARLHYRFTVPPGTGAGPLTLRLPGAPAVTIAWGGPQLQLAADASSPPAGTPPRAAEDRSPRVAAEERGDSFAANLSTYEPIYAVYGPGTNSDARLQISFRYQFFGTPDRRTSWVDRIMFGYTQRMLWDLGRNSSPFRDVDYMPELYYALPRLATIGSWAIGGRFGARHQSNGRSGTASRSVNILYLEPEAKTRIGGADLVIGPRVWAYVGTRSGNPDIARYRGHAGLFARIGSPGGLQLDASGRLNAGSGKGAAEALVSYPLPRLLGGGPKLYLFGQGFVGYGENLLDYDRHQTRVRAGIGITR